MSSQEFTPHDLKELIISSLQLEDVSPDDIKNDEPLFGGRFELDSIDALELIVAIESRVGTRIRAEDVQTDDFKTLESLYGLIQRRRAEGSSGH